MLQSENHRQSACDTQYACGALLVGQLSQPSGMRGAIRRPTGDGVLDQELGIPNALVLVSPPLLFPPGTLHIPPGRPQKIRAPIVLASEIASEISLIFGCRFGSQNDPKSLPKSNQNHSKNPSKIILIF